MKTSKFSSTATARLGRAMERIRTLEDRHTAARAAELAAAQLEDPLTVAQAANRLAQKLEFLAESAELAPSLEQKIEFLFEADGAIYISDDPAEIAAVNAAKNLIVDSVLLN